MRFTPGAGVRNAGERAVHSLKLAEKMFVATGAEVIMRRVQADEVMDVVWHKRS